MNSQAIKIITRMVLKYWSRISEHIYQKNSVWNHIFYFLNHFLVDYEKYKDGFGTDFFTSVFRNVEEVFYEPN